MLPFQMFLKEVKFVGAGSCLTIKYKARVIGCGRLFLDNQILLNKSWYLKQ